MCSDRSSRAFPGDRQCAQALAKVESQDGRTPLQVFVGNVPYDATEERLRDMFSEVGPVHDFRCEPARGLGPPIR